MLRGESFEFANYVFGRYQQRAPTWTERARSPLGWYTEQGVRRAWQALASPWLDCSCSESRQKIRKQEWPTLLSSLCSSWLALRQWRRLGLTVLQEVKVRGWGKEREGNRTEVRGKKKHLGRQGYRNSEKNEWWKIGKGALERVERNESKSAS